MLWLYILLIIAFVIFIILLLPIKLYVCYKEDAKVIVQYAFIKFSIYPKKTKQKNKPQKDNKKKDTSDKKKEEPKKKSKLAEKGIGWLIDVIKRILNLVEHVLKDFFKHFIITNILFKISVSEQNAADTAIKYGELCGVVYPAINILSTHTVLQNYDVSITPNFDEKAKTEMQFECRAKIKLLWIITLVFKYGIKGLKLMFKLK